MSEETLEEFLIRNKDRIEYVNLTWTYNEYRALESKYRAVSKSKGEFEVFMVFNCTILDWEYSCRGTIEYAIEYAQAYYQWDGKVSDEDIHDGVLEKQYENYNPDYNYHPDELDLSDRDVVWFEYLGYMIYTDGDHVHRIPSYMNMTIPDYGDDE